MAPWGCFKGSRYRNGAVEQEFLTIFDRLRTWRTIEDGDIGDFVRNQNGDEKLLR